IQPPARLIARGDQPAQRRLPGTDTPPTRLKALRFVEDGRMRAEGGSRNARFLLAPSVFLRLFMALQVAGRLAQESGGNTVEKMAGAFACEQALPGGPQGCCAAWPPRADGGHYVAARPV